MQRREGGFSVPPGTADDVADVKHPIAELDAGVEVPETERAATRADAIGVRRAAVERGQIPGHGAVWHDPAPFEIAVAALPRIAEHELDGVRRAAPADVQTRDRDRRRGQAN